MAKSWCESFLDNDALMLSATSSLSEPASGSGQPFDRCIWRITARYDLAVPWHTLCEMSASTCSCSLAGKAGKWRSLRNYRNAVCADVVLLGTHCQAGNSHT